MTDTEILIIGAGPTGLGAAWRLDALGRTNWLLAEATGEAGGLARSVVDGHGFTWDLGGHVQFSHYEAFDVLMDDLLGSDGWLYHDRESWVWVRGGFVPYPFQLNIHRLPADERNACLHGLEHRVSSPEPPRNFGEWIDQSFGDAIAQVFMRPYNVKVWAHPPELMGWNWIGDRVAVVDVERVRTNVALERDDVSWGPNNRFRFPRTGGTGAVWKALAHRLARSHSSSLRFNTRLERLDTRGHCAYFSDGTRVRYGRLLSTMPLDGLVQVSDLPREVHAAVHRLAYSSTHVVGVGLHGTAGAHLHGKCWMYFPESDCPFYRVTHFSHYSPLNVPDPRRYWSLMAEVSESRHKPVNTAQVVGDTVAGLIATGLVENASQVHHTWHMRLDHGYPVPSLERDEVLDAVLPALEARDIYSRGRFGAWKYEVSNQDHSFAQGVEVVDHWATGAVEETLHMPDRVNARRPASRVAIKA